MKSILILVGLTLAAILAGAGQGMRLFDILNRPHATADSAPAEAAGAKIISNVRDLKPIVTNLLGPAGAWIRLEAALIVDPKTPIDEKEMSELTNDVVSYLRTLSAQQIEGAVGLRWLREDLSERIALRSAGRAREVLIQTLVVQ